MCLSGAIAIGAGIMSVAVWREKVYEFVVGVHTSFNVVGIFASFRFCGCLVKTSLF